MTTLRARKILRVWDITLSGYDIGVGISDLMQGQILLAVILFAFSLLMIWLATQQTSAIRKQELSEPKYKSRVDWHRVRELELLNYKHTFDHDRTYEKEL